jgi:hypothetical protein
MFSNHISQQDRIASYVKTHYDGMAGYNSDDSSAYEASSFGSFTANIASK